VNTELHFATGNDVRQTPPEVFDPLNDEFRFCVDLAATEKTCRVFYDNKHPIYLGPDHYDEENRDALTVAWNEYTGVGWCNPPYSRGLQAQFIAKASREAKKGFVTVMLLPARPDTTAFHHYIYDKRAGTWRPGVEVRFIQGRIGFLDENGEPIRDKHGRPTKAPFPSMIVIFRRPSDVPTS
jgi:hypothetical protein